MAPGGWPWALLKCSAAPDTCLKPASLVSNLLSPPGNFLSPRHLSVVTQPTSPQAPLTPPHLEAALCTLTQTPFYLLSTACPPVPLASYLPHGACISFLLAVVEKGRDPALHLGCKPHNVQGMTLPWPIPSSFPNAAQAGLHWRMLELPGKGKGEEGGLFQAVTLKIKPQARYEAAWFSPSFLSF